MMPNVLSRNMLSGYAGFATVEDKSSLLELSLSDFLLGKPMRNFYGVDAVLHEAKVQDRGGKYHLTVTADGELVEDELVDFADVEAFYHTVRGRVMACN